MQQPSRTIFSNQLGIHADLASMVSKHINTLFRKPIAAFNQQAFSMVQSLYQQHQDDFILDSGCGIGESTRHLAEKHPNAFVLGIDQSALRINSKKHWKLPKNSALVRADLVDFWRLAADSNWHLSQHYLLYPNPWPKKKHLQRRWHGHPIFPTLKTLGGQIELRTNWKIYAEEFSEAMTILTQQPCQLENWVPENPITPFERKYQLANHDLYRVIISLEDKRSIRNIHGAITQS